jgi:hypothetical protein
VSPFHPFLPPQCDVYPKGPRRLPSLPTTHDRIVISLSTTHYPLFFALYFHTLTNCSSLLPAGLLAGNSFVLITIRIAPGCGDLCALSRHSPLPLYFHTLTNPFSHNSLVFTSIQNPGVSPSLACSKNVLASVLSGPLWQIPFFQQLAASLRSQESQLLCNQANPASFSETPGVWGPQ